MQSLFVAGCFFLSGMAGLVYEFIWVRLLLVIHYSSLRTDLLFRIG